MSRVLSREDLSRTLAAYGAFAASGRIMDGDDQATLFHLRQLRTKLGEDDDRTEAFERVIRNLEAIVAAEAQG